VAVDQAKWALGKSGVCYCRMYCKQMRGVCTMMCTLLVSLTLARLQCYVEKFKQQRRLLHQ